LTLAVALLFTPVGLGTAQAATTTCDYTTSPPTCITTFTYTGAAQSWTAPSGVTQAIFVVDGAQGGTGQLAGGTQGTGGLGGRTRATLTVSPGQIYQLMVGGTGSVTAGGFNGGGAGGTSTRSFNGAGGGGASDVRSGACAAALNCALADRRIIAGGGGGGAAYGGDGGSGGQLGGNGTTLGNGTAGTGGTATSGGVGGGIFGGGSTPGAAGQLGLGGDGGFAYCSCGGPGGGGGGLYGGGGGGWQGGGGGGSSFGPAGTTFQSGVRAGNGQIAITYNIQPDTTGPVANPTLSPAPNAAGWNNTNVTVNWNWTDPLNGSVPGSGIVNSLCETSSTSNLGVGTQTFTAYCVDEASNQTQASYTVKVDRAAPAIRATLSPAANGFGWNNSAVTVSFTCQEQGTLSGIATNTVGGNQTFSSEGANFTASSTGTCTDNADNVATAVTAGPIKIDLTKPTISAAAATAPNANGWYNSDVTVQFTCADNLSGAFACPVNQTLSSEGTAVSSTAQTVSDRALNGSDPSNVVTVKIDKTSPSVLVTSVTNGATYAFGSVPTAACSTSDALAGVATQATLNVTGGNSDGTGSFTATCSGATDNAGNSAAPVSVSYSVTPPADTTAPVITPNVVGTLGNNGWYISDVTVSWTVVDAESAISSQNGCTSTSVTSDASGVTFTCSATSAGGSSSESVTIKRDATAPTSSAAAATASNANGWYNSNVTVQFTCNDNLSGVVSCPVDEILSSEGSAVSSTAQTITDQAGNSSAASNVVTVQIDKTAPVVTVTGVSAGASYTVGSVPTAGCTTTDALSGVATQATASVTGGNGDGTGTFTATCSGATDVAGNSAAPVSVSYSVTAVVTDACTNTTLRDNFNRANGGLGSNWAGLTSQTFYKIASNQVDVQLGGPVVWKPTTFGVNQAAFVTLSTLDAASPAQGLLLKVQSGIIPNGGAIAVVYDNRAKAVRVATLRLNTPTWTVYGNTPATVANGDKLVGCVKADGTVRVYQNNTLLTTVTLNAADQSFFNAKGGKIGLWTVAAPNAFFDDFGGGALTGVTNATLDATAIPNEVADDGAELTVAVDFPTDVAAPATPDAGTLVNRAFLPLVNR
jgi:hypothetical protein